MSTANRTIVKTAAGLLAAIAGAAGIGVMLSGSAPVGAQNLGSPDFASPPEVRSRPEKVLRAVMEMSNGKYTIPNVGTESVRQFRGWDPGKPAPSRGTDISPGPTLRARIGDQVQISFLNKIDDSVFPYSFDTNSPPGYSTYGCDKSGDVYPGKDFFPNCFHGSSTANIHFHGTHTDPDGLGDNVLVQILPQAKQRDWSKTFNTLFDSGKIPQRWIDMPKDYRDRQMRLIKDYDTAAAAAAKKNGLQPPESLYDADQEMIDAGEWPQYLMGAFPNFFPLPDFASGKYKAGQAPGTHWYHAHKHGSTSLHILNGLAGAFVIESNAPGGYDHVIRAFYTWGDSYGDHEKILVFQQYDVTQNLERLKNITTGGGPPNQGPGSKRVLINGKLTPTITMRPGEVQLWRLVNATEGNTSGVIPATMFATAQKAGFKFQQTAQDGVQFSPNNYQNQPFLGTTNPVPGGLTLGGGNRADLLVQAPTTPGVVTFLGAGRVPATVFFVNVTGTPVTPDPGFPKDWPAMPSYLANLPDPGPNDIKNPNSPVKFQWEAGRTGVGLTNGFPPHFMINNKQFGETGEVVDQCMPLDGLQDWVLENYSTPPHPFHIHINPFQVLKIETPSTATPGTYTTWTPTPTLTSPKGDGVWQDVIALPTAVFSSDGKTIWPSRVTIRQRYVDFSGTYVLHCHILAHEDRGMMQLVRVVPMANYPKACQTAVPAHR